jgi:hypothetical protein
MALLRGSIFFSSKDTTPILGISFYYAALGDGSFLFSHDVSIFLIGAAGLSTPGVAASGESFPLFIHEVSTFLGPELLPATGAEGLFAALRNAVLSGLAGA